MLNNILLDLVDTFINLLASPSAGATALKYGDVNTVTPSPGEVKGLRRKHHIQVLQLFLKYLIITKISKAL